MNTILICCWVCRLATFLFFVGAANLAEASGGRVIAWGDIYYAPRVPEDLTNVVAIAAGGGQFWEVSYTGFGLALRSDGTVTAWGVQTNVPGGLSNVVAISAGSYHSLALTADGNVFAWNAQTQMDVPPNITNIVAISAGENRSLALRCDGQVLEWGDTSVVPVGLTNAVAVAEGSFSCALKPDGKVVAWDYYEYGQKFVPSNLTNVVAIAAGTYYGLALQAGGTVRTWGGDRLTQGTNLPPGLTHIIDIAASHEQALALRADGAVFAWGYPNRSDTNSPPVITNAIAIAAGSVFSLAIITDDPTLLRPWPPVIQKQPEPQKLFTGDACSLSVAADASGLVTYQWFLNGNALPQGTGPVLDLASVRLSDSGIYSVAVSNAVGFAISEPANVSVTDAAPFIISQSTTQQILFGDPIFLNVTANGSKPLHYQWNRNGRTIAGETNATFIIPSATSANLSGPYTVTVTNSLGSVESDPIQLLPPFEYDFMNGPYIWDFSGDYSPLVLDQGGLFIPPLIVSGRLAQGSEGSVTFWGADGTTRGGTVTGNGTGAQFTFLVRSASSWGNRYYSPLGLIIDFTRTTCSTSYKIVPNGGSLAATTACIDIVEHHPWPNTDPILSKDTYTYSGPSFSQSAPSGASGRWKLSLKITRTGNELSGKATITLSSGGRIDFQLTGAKSPASDVSSLMSQDNGKSISIRTYGLENRLLSLVAHAAGQDIQYVTSDVFSVNVNGMGAVKPFVSGQTLNLGEDYQIVATPGLGNVFSNWVIAGVIVTNPILNFTVTPNLSITANFRTNNNIFLPNASGPYYGLFSESIGVRQNSAGAISLMVNSSGRFSGKLSFEGGNAAFTGQLDPWGEVQLLIGRKNKSSLTLQLRLDSTAQEIGGSVSDGTWIAELEADRAFSSSGNPATNYVGVYTLVIPGGLEPDGGFVGDGWISFWIEFSGAMHITGELADGTRFSQGARISNRGQWPLYTRLYGGKGSIMSWITLSNFPVTTLGGELVWFKPARSRDRYYSSGLTNQSSTIGSCFIGPLPSHGFQSLDFTNTVVILEGGNLPVSITNVIGGKASVGTNNFTLKWNPISGLVRGSFKHPVTRKLTPLHGVILQKQDAARGYFLGTNTSGLFRLEQLSGP